MAMGLAGARAVADIAYPSPTKGTAPGESLGPPSGGGTIAHGQSEAAGRPAGAVRSVNR
jgi:hypothetical protein